MVWTQRFIIGSVVSHACQNTPLPSFQYPWAQKGPIREAFNPLEYTKGGFIHSMPCPCRSPAMLCVNSHMPCRAPALFQQCCVIRESPCGSRKYLNC